MVDINNLDSALESMDPNTATKTVAESAADAELDELIDADDNLEELLAEGGDGDDDDDVDVDDLLNGI